MNWNQVQKNQTNQIKSKQIKWNEIKRSKLTQINAITPRINKRIPEAAPQFVLHGHVNDDGVQRDDDVLEGRALARVLVPARLNQLTQRLLAIVRNDWTLTLRVRKQEVRNKHEQIAN
jgi:hypothetical protein